MQVCTLLQTDNHASTPPLSFLQAGGPSNSVKALKANNINYNNINHNPCLLAANTGSNHNQLYYSLAGQP